MRIAVVDVGTNTTRLYVASVGAGRIQSEELRLSRVTRLGAGVDASGRLAEAALAREHAVLADYHERIRALEVDRAVAVMTSAVRDAEDGPAFAAEAADRYGLEVHVLSGDAEAELTYRGATDTIAPESGERILVIDVGGGSTELILGRGIRADFHVSTQAGVVRQSDRHLHHDPPTDAELQALAADVATTLAAGVPESGRGGVERTLAVAGTATSLAAIHLGLEPYDSERVHGFRLHRDDITAILERLGPLDLAARRRIRGLHPDRAQVMVPGILILLAAMRLFGLDALEVSEHDILRGAALAYSEA